MYHVLGDSIYTYAQLITLIDGMTNGGYTDYFLPTLNTYLAQLEFGGNGTGLFWTSTTGIADEIMTISNGGGTVVARNPTELGRSMLAGRWADVATDITV